MLAVGAAAPAAAHTQVQRATPGPGEEVDGPVDAVVLDFLDPLLEAPAVEVTGPDGGPVPGLRPAVLDGDDVARVAFDPLTEPGAYQVTYDYASRDGAPQRGAHRFRIVEPADDGLDLRPALGLGVAAVVVALAGAAVVGRVRQDR